MSGGSLDYVYHKVQDAADTLSDKNRTPLQRAFSAHLRKVAIALYEVEMVLSGDAGAGADELAIKAVLGDSANAKAFAVLQEDANKLIEELKKLVEK